MPRSIKSGFTMIEILLAVGLTAVMVLGMSGVIRYLDQLQNQMKVKAVFLGLDYTVAQLINDRDTWRKTISRASNLLSGTGKPNMGCLLNDTDCSALTAAAGYPFDLSSSTDNVLNQYEGYSKAATDGFTIDGDRCNTFVQPPGAGNDNFI